MRVLVQDKQPAFETVKEKEDKDSGLGDIGGGDLDAQLAKM